MEKKNNITLDVCVITPFDSKHLWKINLLQYVVV